MPPRWTKEEVEYMQDVWGSTSIPRIAKKLGKTINAVKNKAYTVGLQCHIHSGDYITLNQLCKALNISYSYSVKKLLNAGLPVKKKKSINFKYRIIDLEDFWAWAEKNKMEIDLSKVEPLVLGSEPGWAKYKREADRQARKYRERRPWSPEEDARLKDMLSRYKYTYRDISVSLSRAEAAIKRRMTDLGIKQRPVIESKHNPWTEEQVKILTDLYYKGYIPEVIAEKIPKSALSISGKIERLVKEGLLEKSRYKPNITYEHRLIEALAVSKKRREFVMSRPEKERNTMRRFASHLLDCLEESKTPLDEEKLHTFMNAWRELNERGVFYD